MTMTIVVDGNNSLRSKQRQSDEDITIMVLSYATVSQVEYLFDKLTDNPKIAWDLQNAWWSEFIL